MLMRSVTRVRCGLVYRPVRRSWANRPHSIMRAVDVLPLVPVIWMMGNALLGSPMMSMARNKGASRGSILFSGARPKSSAYTLSTENASWSAVI